MAVYPHNATEILMVFPHFGHSAVQSVDPNSAIIGPTSAQRLVQIEKNALYVFPPGVLQRLVLEQVLHVTVGAETIKN